MNSIVKSGTFQGIDFDRNCRDDFKEKLFNASCQPIKHKRPPPTKFEREKENEKNFKKKKINFHSILGYFYGFLAVFIVSALSLAGLLAFPIIYKVSFQYVLTLFTALAVGTLFGDTMFHLIPFVSDQK